MEILKRTPLEVKTLTPELYPATLDLYKGAFGDKAEYSPYIRTLLSGNFSPWEWKYGKNSVRIIALRGNELVGHVGAVVRTFSVFGRNITGAELIDGVIKSLFRDVFALKAIFERIEEELTEKGVKLAILFPNKNSQLLARRRATSIKEVPLFEKRVQKTDSAQVRNIERVTSFQGAGLGKVFEAINKGFIGTKRTANYLNKRFLEHPFEEYRAFLFKEKEIPVGYVVLKKHKKELGHIIDLAALSEESLRTLIAFSESSLADWGAETLSLYSPTPECSKLLDKMGYQRRPWRPFVLLSSKTNSIPGMENLDNWYITMSEHGIF